ncbi:MAG: aspartyl protease family protein [Sphingosinicella sp.]|nr:aspartyl protease family protein [Sphingosinicella sp.]
MFVPRFILALALTGSAAAAGVGMAQQAPKIGKPRPAPSAPSTMAPLPPAIIDNKLAVEGEEIKAREVETRLSVEVRVNGRGPYQFLVDSGADTSVVGLRLARELQLPLGTPVLLNNMTDRNIVDRVLVDELSLGSSKIRYLELPALRDQDIGGAGLIGIDALASQRLMMDFEKRVIKVEDASIPVKTLHGEIVVTARRRRGQLILTQVSAGRLSLEAVIDTGSQITIGNLALRDKLVRRNRAKMQTVAATGVTGKEVELQFTQIPELRLGPITFHNVPMAFADVPPFEVFGLSDQPALLLGTDLLETFRRVSLDFKSRKVRFQLRRCRQSVTISTAQMSLSTPLTRLSTTGGAEVCGR